MEGRIVSYLENLAPVAGHNPWPRYEVDAEIWTGAGDVLGAGSGELIALWGEQTAVHMALRADGLSSPCVLSIAVADGGFPSIGRHHAPAIRLERTVQDLYGHVPMGANDERPWIDHGAWGVRAPLGAREPSARRDPADYPFRPVHGHGLHEIPVGPVHAGIIEPGHFRFTANGEIVVRLEERLGYVHKGIDGLLNDAELTQAQKVAARVSGDSTVAASFAFARAFEAAVGLEPPARAQVVRGVMAELERIANHLGDIGAVCNDAAFALIHAHCGILRERVLAACDDAFGHRLMMDRIVPGGVAQDLDPQGANTVLATLDAIEPRFAEIVRVYDDTPSLQDRTCNTGIVAPDLVARWAAGGHVGRASGRDFDTRRDLPYPPYDKVALDVPVLRAGDVNARVWVRIREIGTSLWLIRAWLAALPSGPVQAALPNLNAVREGVAMAEAFRGDLLVWLRVGPRGKILRGHVRDASWFQWPLLEAAIADNIVADFPLCNKSFNCSYSGADV